MGMGIAVSASATINFSASDIQYWVGTGSNQAVVVIAWDDYTTPTAYAWGVRWNDNVSALDLVDSIQAYDSRFHNGSTATVASATYTENGVTLTSENDFWCYTVNGQWATVGYTGYTMSDGDIMEISGSCYFTMTTAVAATDPNPSNPTPVEATIAQSDILYWVGEGTNAAVLAVNWADTALAWGYRFDGSSVTVADMMQAIADDDPRFSFSGTGFVNDITFNDGTVSLAGTPGNYWGSTNNGVSDMGMSQILANGDLEKWGDPAAGVVADSMEWDGYWYYTYVYPMTIHPVSAPYVAGPFCGPVGTDGCDAIAATSGDIVAWATACTVVRGPQDISDADSPLASFGSEDNAVGQATVNTMLAVSLGDGGMATLTFEKPIANGEGPDFAVFENAIRSQITGGYFMELAFVEVSSDGERFVRFPATSLTTTDVQVGSYGEIDPTYINNLAGKYEVGYGTPFDLAELADSTGLDINRITHVRVVDVVGSIDPQYATYDAFGHMVNDPWPTPFASGGFDLTGVAVMHQNTESVEDVVSVAISVYPNPATEQLTVSGAAGCDAVLYDMTGRQLGSWQIDSDRWHLQVNRLFPGVYMLRVGAENHRIVKR